MGIINFRNKYEDIYQAVKDNKGLQVIYGVTGSDIILRDSALHVDYFVDRRAKDIKCINDISVIEPKHLEKYAKNKGGKVTIIIGIGLGASGTINSIYNDIVALDIDADVFDYFTNVNVFAENIFSYKGKEYPLFEHPFNCGYKDTRMTERAVEISLAKEWINNCEGKITEIGAVTPYYFTSEKIADIVDPMDGHILVTEHASIFECDLKDRNVLSISTIEHIGVGDYGFKEDHNAVEGIMKILNESKHCLITVPYGFNEMLDRWVLENRKQLGVTVLNRGANNAWKEINHDEGLNGMCIGVNGLVIIEK